MHTDEFQHPECQKKEVFFMNMKREVFDRFDFSSKRLGKQTFNGLGEQIFYEDWYPVFVSKEELDTYPLTLMELRRKMREINS